MKIRDVTPDDRGWIRTQLVAAWGMPVVTPVDAYAAPEELDALVADVDGERLGAVTWSIQGGAWEVVTLQALRPRVGLGRALMAAVRRRAESSGAARIWLITTDDNPTGIAFYTAIGMRRVRVLRNFSARVRRFKPEAGGETYDAIEYEWDLGTP